MRTNTFTSGLEKGKDKNLIYMVEEKYSQGDEPEILIRPMNKHWKKLQNLFRASCLFSRFSAEIETDIDEMMRDIEKRKTDKVYRLRKDLERKRSPFTDAIENHRREQAMFEVLQKGSTEDLPILADLLENDPSRLMRNTMDPHFLLNVKNPGGFAPLHIACRNGNLEFVKFLLEKGANWMLCTDLEKETCLEIAARWGFLQIVIELMQKTWSPQVIVKARKVSATIQIKKQLKVNKAHKHCSCWKLS